MNNYTWGGPRDKPKCARVHNIDAHIAMESRLAAIIEQKMGNLNPKQTKYCDFYNGGHPNHKCPSMGTTVEHVDFIQRNRQSNNL